MKHTLTLAAAACALLLVTAPAQAVLIDLNDFFASPAANVSILVDGSSATMSENNLFADTLLTNNPLFDPNVIIAGVGTILSFDYSGFNPTHLGDSFGAYIINPLDGLSVGAPFEFFTTSSASGSVSFDLSALDGQDIGLEFQLFSNVYNRFHPTIVTVSNVQLLEEVIGPNPVPEPGMMAIFGLGLAGLGFARRRKMVSAK